MFLSLLSEREKRRTDCFAFKLQQVACRVVKEDFSHCGNFLQPLERWGCWGGGKQMMRFLKSRWEILLLDFLYKTEKSCSSLDSRRTCFLLFTVVIRLCSSPRVYFLAETLISRKDGAEGLDEKMENKWKARWKSTPLMSGSFVVTRKGD